MWVWYLVCAVMTAACSVGSFIIADPLFVAFIYAAASALYAYTAVVTYKTRKLNQEGAN